MLELYDLPDEELLERYTERFPQLDVPAQMCFLQTMRVASDVETWLNSLLAKYNISQRRFFILILLSRRSEGWTPSELAKGTGVTNATMTGVLDTLVKDGLVKRKIAPDDRRVKMVSLTPEGEDAIYTILPDYYERVATMMREFSPEERTMLRNILDKLSAGLACI
ncbi:MarR family winged helix-turn-helix transcriptional regulator [Pseudodesulfovibrio senegalensis]|jgi:DNA-binding MarR family transcriptional regulator|uniref:MarR family transcriptional regulator n=1 Tax=Pseudodesulfovibrio senegalensis TaxID=1721087 RepID=A0A6N6N6I8_9BACT|nr:MarR family transcriptional regulator [Pseudodesulfovibrio senegalensis]KAB1443513.1 MarR family transcriptional regulator [Pseudodesulfovibrio senegalensis]